MAPHATLRYKTTEGTRSSGTRPGRPRQARKPPGSPGSPFSQKAGRQDPSSSDHATKQSSFPSFFDSSVRARSGDVHHVSSAFREDLVAFPPQRFGAAILAVSVGVSSQRPRCSPRALAGLVYQSLSLAGGDVTATTFSTSVWRSVGEHASDTGCLLTSSRQISEQPFVRFAVRWMALEVCTPEVTRAREEEGKTDPSRSLRRVKSMGMPKS